MDRETEFADQQAWLIREMDRAEYLRRNAPQVDKAHEKAKERRFTGCPLTGFGALDNQQEAA